MTEATNESNPGTVYAFSAASLEGRTIPLSDYTGKVLLIVNTASKCGFTPQYAGLEELSKRFHAQGFEVLGFPCNQFGAQEPGTAEEIGQFCERNYGVTFPMFSKIDVNGADTHPLFKFLKSQKSGLLGAIGLDQIKWNFTKFLVDRSGHVVERFAPTTTPAEIAPAIEKLL